MIHPLDKKLFKMAAKVPIFVWVIILIVGLPTAYYAYKEVRIRIEWRQHLDTERDGTFTHGAHYSTTLEEFREMQHR